MTDAKLAELREAAAWVDNAIYALESYEADCGERLPEDHQIGRIDDSRNSASWRFYVGHLRRLKSALSTTPPASEPDPSAIRKQAFEDAAKIAKAFGERYPDDPNCADFHLAADEIETAIREAAR